MTRKIGSEPAFIATNTNPKQKYTLGLTKREYIAALAMQGMLACSYQPEQISELASVAVKNADALLEALENSDD